MENFKKSSYLLFSAVTVFILQLGTLYFIFENTWTIMGFIAIISYSFATIFWLIDLYIEKALKGLREQNIQYKEQRELIE